MAPPPFERSPGKRGTLRPRLDTRRSRSCPPIWRGFGTRIRSRRIGNRRPSVWFACIGGMKLPILLILAYVVMRFALLMWRGI